MEQSFLSIEGSTFLKMKSAGCWFCFRLEEPVSSRGQHPEQIGTKVRGASPDFQYIPRSHIPKDLADF